MATAEAPSPLTVRLPAYVPHRPEPPQHAFLFLDDLDVLEALYGGAAGGGKSDALLMGALRYVHVPNYAALLLRRTYPELTQADGLITRADLWLADTDAEYNATDHTWTFPSGARLQFGYLKAVNDRLRYQGGAYQFIGFDELTQFRQADYRYLLSRLRRPSGIGDDDPLASVPLRLRGATNPGGPGHEWVKRRFVEWEPDPDDPTDPELSEDAFRRRIFIPARLEDNPHLDQAAYRRSLAGLPRQEREQLLAGDWNVDTGDTVYPRAEVAAALELGDVLDELAAAGRLPPPAGPIPLSADFGEHTHGLLAYPLPHGGLYVVAGEELSGVEPGSSTSRILALADALPAWPGRRHVRDALLLITELRYDPGSAGAQSVRTFARIARARHRALRTVAIPFGDYKRESIGYLRWLMENARDLVDGVSAPIEQGTAAELELGDGAPLRVGVLAVSASAGRLRQQLRGYMKDPNTGEPVKEDDHGPDALVAAVAPIARRHRDRNDLERRRANARAQAIATRLPRP